MVFDSKRTFAALTGLLALSLTCISLLPTPRPEVKKNIPEAKNDKPDEYIAFHRRIRTPENATEPAYTMGYKFREMRRANIPLDSRPQLKRASTLSWVERGPANVAGRTRGIIVDPADGTHSTWLAGGASGGIWKTTNQGDSWINKSANLSNLAIAWLVYAPGNPDVMYAATGEGFGGVGMVDGGGILKSTDHGETWMPLASTESNTNFINVNRIIVDPNDEDHVVAATNNGIYRSTNGGTSWETSYSSSSRIQDIDANPLNFNTQYAGTSQGVVLKSVDGGVTWTASSDGILGGRVELAVSPVDTGTIYASVHDDALYRSRDGAATWKKIDVKTPGGTDHFDHLGGQGWYDNIVAAHPYDTNTVFVGGVDIFKITVSNSGEFVETGIQGIDTVGTASFLSFTNFGLTYMGGGIEIGTNEGLGTATATNLTLNDFVSVQLRFGPGKTQKAHLDTTEQQGAGQIASQFHFKSYVDVPFEVWDITNNKQLMVSFRDENRDGEFDLNLSNADGTTCREYMFIHAVDYDANNPDPNIMGSVGIKYKTIYEIGPKLPDGATWNGSTLPASTLTINWGSIAVQPSTITAVTDAYGSYPGGDASVHPDQHNIVIIPVSAPDNFKMINGNDGGLALSTNSGVSFLKNQNTVRGYNTTQFYGVDKKPGASVYIGGTQDNGTWISPGNPTSQSSYTFVIGGDGFDAVWNYYDPNLVLGSVYTNSIRRSTNGGGTFAVSTSGLLDAGVEGNSPFTTQIANSKKEPNYVFAIGSRGVYRSTNFGSNWTLAGITNQWGYSRDGWVAVSESDPNIVWAGNQMSSSGAPQVSRDGGATFTATAKYNVATLGVLSGLSTHPLEDSTAFALFSFAGKPKILRTTDLGNNWEDLSGFGANSTSNNGFPDVAVTSLLVMPHNPSEIWAGTEIGIFVSTDNGATWAYSDFGLPAVSIWEMKIVDKQVVVATHGRGIWTVDIAELPATIMSPSITVLSQNNNDLGIYFKNRSVYDSTVIRVNQQRFMKIYTGIKDTSVNYPVTVSGNAKVYVIGYKDGLQYPSVAKQTTVAFDPDIIAPTLSLGALATPVLDVVRFGIGANEPLSSATLSVNSSSVAVQKQGDIFFGTYKITDTRTLSVTATGQDTSNNTSNTSASFTVAELAKSLSVGKFQFKGSGQGYLLVHEEDVTDLPAGWVSVDTKKNLVVTGSNNLIDLEVSLADLNELRSQVSNLDESKIGLYAFEDGQWIYVGGEGHHGKLSATTTAKSLAALYNPDHISVPASFTLEQNYPNPFNPSTTIAYSVPKAGHVTIKVYNVLGQEVRTLVNQVKDVGRFNIQWDGRNSAGLQVSSGVYLYRMEAGRFVKTQKMLFIK